MYPTQAGADSTGSIFRSLILMALIQERAKTILVNLTTPCAIAQEIVIMKRALIVALCIIAGYQVVYTSALAVTSSVVNAASQRHVAQLELAMR